MAKLVPVDPFDLIIFGGSGDLAMRKLLPALFHRNGDGQVSANSRIIAVGRSPMLRDDYLDAVRESVETGLKNESVDSESWESFSKKVYYVELDIMDSASWSQLVELLADSDEKVRAAYLATSPSLFGAVAHGLRDNQLIIENMRIVLEKPIGSDLASAKAINDAVGECFSESQIFRIDHYLGKETVQNLLALRFGNALFEPLWSRQVIDHVQITVAEELGVGNRIDFYNETGALRDMVQNHLMQLLCLVAMEVPASLDGDAVRDEKLKVLRALKKLNPAEAKVNTVRAQYRAGAINGNAVPGYVDELGAASPIETYVAIKAEINNWRWSGVPFYLRTGKRLAAKHSEILIQFRSVPHVIFDDVKFGIKPNQLSIQLQPNEGVKLSIMSKEPGPGPFDLRPVSLDLSFEEAFGAGYRDSYERLLMEVIRGNQALFMRRDEVETAWSWSESILAGWAANNQKMDNYVAGSSGPASAEQLIGRDGRVWGSDE